MSIEPIREKLLRERIAEALKLIRLARNHDEVDREFYVFLGLTSAACTLDAITMHTAARLHDLALNASQHRADEISAAARAERQRAQGMKMEAAA